MTPRLPDRLADGLIALSLALQSGQRKQAADSGLSPTQLALIMLMASRPAESLRMGDLARELGVSQPTITDSVAALLSKRLVRKMADPDDQRAVRVGLTKAGLSRADNQPALNNSVLDAIAELGEPAQEQLLVLLSALIRSLQETGTIAPQRQCVTCQHFRPFVHTDARQPHHCAFVNAAFGSAELRFQCADHEAAGAEVQSANWASFSASAEILRANKPT